MSEPATDPHAAPDLVTPAPARPTVAALAAEIGPPAIEARAAARSHAAPSSGRLADLGGWLAETQGSYPPAPPARIRLLVFGAAPCSIGDPVAALAETHGVGVGAVEVQGSDASAVSAAFDFGVGVADAAVEEGADLLLLSGADDSAAPGVLVSAFTGTEPVALLPRGADAVDTADWIARAERLRDQRRRVTALRHDPDELLVATGSPVLAALAGCVLRATARRTPLVLDGVAAVSAALLVNEQRATSARWWQVADTSIDPVHALAVEDLDRTPVLGLGITRGDGTAALLSVPVLRAAAAVANASADTTVTTASGAGNE